MGISIDRQGLGLPTAFSAQENDIFATRFASSPFVSPRVLAAIRCLFALWNVTTLIVVLAILGTRFGTAGQTFSYFTHLTYWGLCGYLVVSAYHTVVFAKTGKVPLATWHPALQLAHTVLYTCITTLPILVTVVFWVILASSDTFKTPFSAYENIAVHALNSVIAIIDGWILSAALPPPLLHLPFLIIILLLYLSLAYLTHATQGFYTYSFLSAEPKPEGVGSRGIVAAYCIGIAVAVVVVFFIAKGILTLKAKFLRKRQGVQDISAGEDTWNPKGSTALEMGTRWK